MYSFSVEKREPSTPGTLHAPVSNLISEVADAEFSGDKIPQSEADVNNKFSKRNNDDGKPAVQDSSNPYFYKNLVSNPGMTVTTLPEDVPNSRADVAVDSAENYRTAAEKESIPANGEAKFSDHYVSSQINHDVLSLVEKVRNGQFTDNEKVLLGIASERTASEIQEITNIDVHGFRLAIEARQIHHILNDHGENGKSDHSMADPNDIARIGYAIFDPDEIRPAGKTKAYTHFKDGKNRLAPTVLYEKRVGEKSYYVVQAVPETKAKTLYVVTAFIGKSGYKKEAQQLINAIGSDATSKNGSPETPKGLVAEVTPDVNNKFSNDSDIRSQIYETATKKEVDGSHDHGQQDKPLDALSTYGVVPSTLDGEIVAQDGDSVKRSSRKAETEQSHKEELAKTRARLSKEAQDRRENILRDYQNSRNISVENWRMTELGILKSAAENVASLDLSEREKKGLENFSGHLKKLEGIQGKIDAIRSKEGELSQQDLKKLTSLEQQADSMRKLLWEFSEYDVLKKVSQKTRKLLMDKYGSIKPGENPSRQGGYSHTDKRPEPGFPDGTDCGGSLRYLR